MTTIITVPSEILRKPTQPVKELNERVLKVLQEMESALKKAKNPEGVGLAAPQIGHALSIFMIRPFTKDPITTFINPQVIKYSQRQINPHGRSGVYEGCLSLPQHYAPIKRSSSVTVKYFNQKMEEQTQTFSGFPAHVIQHEMDHLNGILFIDRVLEQNSKLFKVNGEEWEEVSL